MRAERADCGIGVGSNIPMEETEFDLIKATGAGDHRAFERLVKIYQNPVFDFIHRYLGDQYAAEDILQDVFLRLYQAAPDFEVRGKLSTWLFRVAYNLSMNEIKRRKRHRTLREALHSSAQVSTDQPAPDAVATKELEMKFTAAMEQLPENQKAAMLLRVNEELSYAEISEVLSVSISSTESLIFRARTRLRQLLKRE
jgi:RNA polymerase sigma-70 factor (ECF subfamily)